MSSLVWDPKTDTAKGKADMYQIWDTDKGIGLYVNNKVVRDIKYDPSVLSKERRIQTSGDIVKELKSEAERRESGDSSIVGLSKDLAAKYGGTKVTTLGFLALCGNCRKVYRPGDATIYRTGGHYCPVCGTALDSVSPEDLFRRGIR